MPRAATKTDLINDAAAGWDKLWKQIGGLPDSARNAEFNFGDGPNLKEAHWKRDKNLRDVLVHLYEWHRLLLNWTAANLNGDAKPFLPEPYNWKTYGQMNVEFWEMHQSTPYESAESMLRESHNQVMTLIESFTDEELFAKKHFSWTGTTNLGTYCVSATVSHYDWAVKKIKRHAGKGR